MKLNIEELAREAGMDTEAGYWECTTEDLEAFARLIVERCAQEATKNANVFPDDGQATAGVIHSAIRNLMED